jgi:hypothetical protein
MENLDYIQHAQLSQTYKGGANWFYWIAGLTIITSIIAFSGGDWRFLISLGSTQVIDAFAEGLSTGLGTAAKVVGLILDLIVTGLFVMFGYLAGKKLLWAYMLGMVVFLLDGLISLLFQDYIGAIAHAVVLFFMFRGYQVGRELVAFENWMAERELTETSPQPEPAV